jgi:general secretion pathway protein C
MAKHINLINTLFIIIIFPVLAFLVKDYLVYRYAPVEVPQMKTAAPAVPKAPEIGAYARIVERPVYAPGPLKFKPLTVSDDTASEEMSSSVLGSLKLLGTFSGKNGFAVIEKKGDPAEKTFRVGDNVFDAGVLKEVRKDSAVISSGSRDFTLVMLRDELPRASEPEVIGAGAVNKTANKTAAPAAKAEWSSEGVKKTGEQAWAVDQKAVLHALDNIGTVLTDARLTPVASKDGVEGFLVNEIKPGGIFETIGLKNGDILKRVNGFEVTSPEKAIQVLTGLRGESSIDLDVVRDGQKMNFHYEIR